MPLMPSAQVDGSGTMSNVALNDAEKSAVEAYDETKQNLGEQSPMLKTAASNLIAIYEKRENTPPWKN